MADKSILRNPVGLEASIVSRMIIAPDHVELQAGTAALFRNYQRSARRSRQMTETLLQPDVTPLQPSQASTSRDRMRSHRVRKRYGLVPRRLLVSRT
jgi:hypothetical protein